MRLHNDRYIFDASGKIVPEPDLIKWAMWYEKAENRRVKQDKIGEILVSTVFLGLDHNFGSEGPPILWETMIFGVEASRDMVRCAGNREQAEAMHEDVVARVKALVEQPTKK